MADQMQPTPRSTVLGLFSDLVNLPLQYMSSPERTQQSQGVAQFLYGTGIPKTLERMSYGDSLFSGAGGLGGTTRMRPETADALMNVAPFAPAAGRLTARAVRATEGLPVGMSIKDVSKSSITREGNPIQSAVVLVGNKIFMGRTHGDALNRAVYEGVVRKEGGKYIFPKGAEVNSDLFMTKDGQIIDRLQASKMFDIGASETAIEKGLMQNNPPKSMTVDSYIEQATTLKNQKEKALYPQQAALDLAQQRAALPVEQGGLGLPANNTPMDRAKAMGFETPVYHATDVDFTAIRPSVKGKYGAGVYTSISPKYAEIYAQGENARTLPLMARGKIASDDERIAIADQILEQYRTNQSMSAPLWKEKTKEELANRGYTGVGIGKERLMFNPEDLRSRFAAFDPFRKDVATATAMGVALPDLLAQPVRQYELPQDTIPMYTDPFGNTIGSSIR